MNLNYLKYFLMVAETCSFTKASERLFITQPSLSVGIQKLEESFGVKLFERGKKQVSLTSSGKYLLSKVRNILNEVELLKDELHQNIFSSQTLKIGILNTLPMTHIAKIIGNFGRAFSNIEIEQVSGNIVELAEWLDEGNIDLVITLLLKEKEVGGISQKPLFQSNCLAAVAEDHPLGKKESLSFSELSNFPYIDRRNCELRNELQKVFMERGIYPKAIYKIESDELSNALIAAGVGVAVVPFHSRIPGIVHLPFSDFKFTRSVGLMWKSQQNLEVINQFHKISTYT